MNSYKESKALLEVREWKELCHQEDKGLSYKEYLKKIRMIAEDLKLEYNTILHKEKAVIF